MVRKPLMGTMITNNQNTLSTIYHLVKVIHFWVRNIGIVDKSRQMH